MSATGNTTSRYLSTAAAAFSPITAAYSYAFWLNAATAPVLAGSSKQVFSLTNSTGANPGGYDINFAWNHFIAADVNAAIHRNADASFAVAQLASTPPHGQWIHIAVVFNGSSLSVYFNGLLSHSVAASAPTATAGSPELTLLAYNSGAAWLDASLAVFTFWNTALTAAEVLEVARATDPTTIHNGNIVSFCNLNVGDLSSIGPVVTNHTAVINNTYFEPTPGGPAVGGNLTTVGTHYGWTLLNQGGPAVGGNRTLTGTHYGWTMLHQGGPAVGGNATTSKVTYRSLMTGGIAMGGNATKSGADYTVSMSGGLAVGGNSQVMQSSPNGALILATGRELAFTSK